MSCIGLTPPARNESKTNFKIVRKITNVNL